MTTGTVHWVKPEDMPPLRMNTGGPVAPGDCVCGVPFFWATDDVTFTANTVYFKGALAFSKDIPVTCVMCLGTVDE